MGTNYPGSLDAYSRPSASTPMNASGYEGHTVVDNLYDAVEAIEAELGTDPAGGYPTVGVRLMQPWNATHGSARDLMPGPDYVTTDPFMSTSNIGLTAQRVLYQRWICPASFSATKLWWVQTISAATVTTAEVGIYDSSGSRLQYASVASAITTTGLKSVTITSQSLTAGSAYYLAILVDASTPGSISGTTAWDSDLAGAFGSSSSNRPVYYQSSQANLPASVTLSGLSLQLSGILMGVSAA